MTARTLTRAGLIAGLMSLGLAATAPAAYAERDLAAEAYVQQNGAAALRTLGDTSVTAAQRRQTFYRLMTQFADMQRVALFVLGPYGSQLRADAQLREDWMRTFQDYAIANYEYRLERFSGSTIRVTNSIERTPGRDVIVVSELAPRGGGEPTVVQWRLFGSGETWKVIDVSLVLEGNRPIWLAQQQQRDFRALLDRNNGDIRNLIATVRDNTANMRERILARS